MKHLISMCAIAAAGILCMALTYQGSAQEQIDNMTLQARETEYKDCTIMTTAGGALINIAPVTKSAIEPVAVCQHSMDMDEEEMEILLRLAENEAGTEDVIGRALVIRTVINRVLSNEFPNSIEEVAFQVVDGYYQFTTVKDADFWTVEVSEKSMEALDMVLSGWDETQGATYFCRSESAYKWHEDNLDFLFSYGCHRFYSEKGGDDSEK